MREEAGGQVRDYINWQVGNGGKGKGRMWQLDINVAINIVAAAAIADLWIESFVFSAVSASAGTCGIWKDNYLWDRGDRGVRAGSESLFQSLLQGLQGIHRPGRYASVCATLSGSHLTMLKPISFPSTNLQTCTCVHVCAYCMCVPQKRRVNGGGGEREIEFRVFS